ncbi:12636_t:CDS:2 [Ambispora leptoticha]|uniref:12636_t:CDS:1 n=1 Tax=Ambispora leptoticha TaxID=144679 RepID=A0A9N9AYQ4_9GLOM|nr:12636_t:CDS:2 [Ambispora leptoticha]
MYALNQFWNRIVADLAIIGVKEITDSDSDENSAIHKAAQVLFSTYIMNAVAANRLE